MEYDRSVQIFLGELEMKTVLFFDTSIATLNIGDEIINYSIKKNWPEIFKENYILTMPTHTPNYHWWQNLLYKRHQIYEKADYKFLCGTNILYMNMLHPEPAWNVFLHNTKLLKNTVCIGAGIGKNSKGVNAYTRALYHKTLSKEFVHSVRDDAAKELLESLGFRAVNTGCPTLWGLTPQFCATIPQKKTDQAIFTLTSYQADQKNDQNMVDIILKNYEKVYFWPQSIKDLEYMKSLKNTEKIEVTAPNLLSYDERLKGDIDYIGNRLHGGIFALQHACRTIIIGIDYRVEEMGRRFSIPYIMREETGQKLDDLINSQWETKIIGLDFGTIDKWKAQF